MIFISPPFGNYFNLPKTIPIRGSFTLNERPANGHKYLRHYDMYHILVG